VKNTNHYFFFAAFFFTAFFGAALFFTTFLLAGFFLLAAAYSDRALFIYSSFYLPCSQVQLAEARQWQGKS
jgi:hypothetical protein